MKASPGGQEPQSTEASETIFNIVRLLVVLNNQKKITRADYNLCPDLEASNPRIEPHLVILPETQAPVTGLWAEIAMSGLILLDPSLEIQRYLSKVRNLIAEGKLLRKRAHGHDYWVHEGVE
jgi:hypothetical protein